MKKYETIFETDTLSLSKGLLEKGPHTGFWLYDKTVKMNLAITADSERDAFVKALEYYQNRFAEIKKSEEILRDKIDSFLLQFNENYDSFGNYPDDRYY